VESEFKLGGRFEIDGSLLAENLSLYFYDDEQTIQLRAADQSIPGARGQRLYLHPLSRNMLRSGLWESPGRSAEYSISGTNVGSFNNGPLGHPADGEFDTWTVTQFSVRATFSRECLAVGIGGTTAQGTSGFYRDGGRYLEPLPPKQFNVTFELPRGEMKQFFGMDKL
jgi:hypothetical protein